MDMDVYQAPKANLVVESESEALFYVVSQRKFLILNIVTLGMYTLYWFYMHWHYYKASTGDNIWPIPRAIFAIFFTHKLFNKIDNGLKAKEAEFRWSPDMLATIYVITAILSHLCDRLSATEIGVPYTDLISWALLPVMIWMLYQAQVAANIACGDSDGKSNAVLTIWNYLWILLGVVFWALIVFGYLYGVN